MIATKMIDTKFHVKFIIKINNLRCINIRRWIVSLLFYYYANLLLRSTN